MSFLAPRPKSPIVLSVSNRPVLTAITAQTVCSWDIEDLQNEEITKNPNRHTSTAGIRNWEKDCRARGAHNRLGEAIGEGKG
jgi:hypothetical protein